MDPDQPSGQQPAAPPAAPPAGAPAQPPAAPPPGTQGTPAAAPPASQQAPAAAPPTDPAKPPAPPAQQAWEGLKLPEGVKPDAFVEGFTKLAKEKGWSQQQAQDAADWFFKTTGEQKKADDAAFQKFVNDDVAALKADPDFGGLNFDRTNAAATSFLTQFDDKDGSAAKLLELVGAKTAAPVVKLLARARAAIADDKSPFPKTGTAGETGRMAELKAMFPNSPEMWTPK